MKKIFKTLIAVSLLLTLALCVVGCAKTEPPVTEEPTPVVTEEPTPVVTEKPNVIGKWTLSAIDVGGEDGIVYMLSMGVNPTDISIELREDGTYTRTLVGGEQSGTYEQVENAIQFTYSDGVDEFTLDGNALSYTEEDTTITFTKDN